MSWIVDSGSVTSWNNISTGATTWTDITASTTTWTDQLNIGWFVEEWFNGLYGWFGDGNTLITPSTGTWVEV